MKKKLLIYLLTAFVFSATVKTVSAQQVSPGPVLGYYVDAVNGEDTNDGLAWGTAFKSLGKALELTNANSSNEIEIHVAEGTYTPNSFYDLHSSTPEAKGPRDYTFLINRNYVKLFGGYPAGGGTRDHILHPTILSGDIGVENDAADNVYHVMIISPTVRQTGTTGNLWTDKNTVVDGFIFTKGNADANGQVAGPTTSAYIRDNKNMAIWKDTGGALFISARDQNATNSPVFTNCIFKENKSTKGGGAVNIQGYTNTIGPSFVNCVFENNTTVGNGGAILADAKSTRSINSKYLLRNCLFINNTSTVEGGAIFSKYNDTFIINSTFYNNTAGTVGGAVSSVSSYRQQYFNSLFWGNVAPNQADISNVTPGAGGFTIKNSLVQSASLAGSNGNVQLSSGPFKDSGNPSGADGKWMTADDGLVPVSGSAAIDKADSTDYKMVPGDPDYNGPWYGVDSGKVKTDLDLAGNLRLNGEAIDIGAYEFQSTLPVNLISFTATLDLDKVVFLWSTASERNNNRFEIERSTDGITFNSIASIPSKGAGAYVAEDKNPNTGVNYYRLVQYDLDGSRAELAIKSLDFSLNSSAPIIYPNPVIDRMAVELGDYVGRVDVTLSDYSGKVLQSVTYNAQRGTPFEIKLPEGIKSGFYLVNIIGNNLNVVHKIIKK